MSVATLSHDHSILASSGEIQIPLILNCETRRYRSPYKFKTILNIATAVEKMTYHEIRYRWNGASKLWVRSVLFQHAIRERFNSGIVIG